jgi:hypothetical protein
MDDKPILVVTLLHLLKQLDHSELMTRHVMCFSENVAFDNICR